MIPPLETEQLSFALIARLRGHGHLCNVLTHVGAGNWRAIEQAIATILRPRARPSEFNPIVRNIVELICDGRGVTGPIMRAVFFDTVAKEAGAERTAQLRRKVARMRQRMSDMDARTAERVHDGRATESAGRNELQPATAIASEGPPLRHAA